MEEQQEARTEKTRKRWSWKKRIVLLCVATVVIWIAGDFIYSRVIAWRVAKWESTIQRNDEGIMTSAVAYSAGEGQSAILFLHGINDTPHVWRNLVPEFADAGYTCRVMRLPGFGESTEKYAASDKDQWLAELEREVELLEADHEHVYLVAHSLGAAIAINWALKNQDRIDGLLLLAPGIEVSDDRSPLLSTRAWHEIGDRLLMFTRITETPFTADSQDPHQREFDGRIRFVGRKTATETFKLIDENRNRAREIKLPLLVAVGCHDHVIDLPAAKEFFDQVESDDKEFFELESSGHAVQVDYDWTELAQEMLKFLDRLQPPNELQMAIRRLEAAGGIVTYESHNAETTTKHGQPTSLMFAEAHYLDYQQFADIALLTELKELNLNDQQRLDDDALWLVSKLKQLKTLNISGTAVTDEGMHAIASVESLKTLYVWRTDIGDAGLIPLANLQNLQLLNVFDTSITDEGLEILGQMKQLRELKIGNTHVDGFNKSSITQTGIRKLRAQLPDTEIVYWTSDDRPEAPTRVLNDGRRSGESSTGISSPIESVSRELPPDIATRRTGSDWSGFLGPNTDSKSDERGIVTDWKKDPPKQVWKLSVGEGFSAPSVSRGRLFVYHRLRNRAKGDNADPDDHSPFVEQLLCVHSETGEEIWSTDFPAPYTDMNGYGDGPRSTPFVDGDRVYILSPAGDLRCLRTIDGELLWQKKLDHEFVRTPDFFGIGTSPIVEGDSLMLIVGGSKKSILDSGVVAFDKLTGDYLYGVSSDMASYASPKFATVDGRRWCFAFTRDGLLAFDPKDGKIDFKYPWQAKVSGCVNAAMPVVVDNQVFISEAYNLGSSMLKFEPGKFEIVWADEKRSRDKTMKAHWNTPIYHEGFLYGCSGRHTNEADLRCIDWKTGEVKWKQEVYDRCSLLLVDDHFVSLGENGKLMLFKATPDSFQLVSSMPADDKIEWPIRYPAWAAPVLSHGLLYIRGKDKLVCLELIRE